MLQAFTSRIEAARARRVLSRLLDQREARPRDRQLGLAIHQAIRSGAKFPRPLIRPPGVGTQQGTLVIVEASIDFDVLHAYLDALPHSHAYLEGPPPADYADAALVTPAYALIGQGTADDHELARCTETFVAQICDALARHAPEHDRIVAGVDTLAVLDFRIGDYMHRIGRIVRGLTERLTSGQYSSVVFLVGNHQLWRSLEGVARAAVGSENIHVFWLPKPADGTVNSTTPPSRSTPSPAAVAPPTDVALLVSPAPDFTRGMSGIAAELARNNHVSILATDDRADAHVGRAGQLAELARNHHDRVTFVCPDRDVAPGAPVDIALRDAIWADDTLKALKLDGATLHPLLKPLVTLALREWRRTRRFAAGFDAYLRSAQPKILVVCPDRTPVARVACQLARAQGVPSFYPVTAMLSAFPRYKELQADYGSLMDDSQVELDQRARPADKGRMFADGITILDAATNAWLANRGQTPVRACVALVLQPMPLAYNADVIQLIGEALAGIDADFVVRAHPREPAAIRENYARLLRKFRRASLDDGPLSELLDRATLVVGAYSAVLIEAAILGRPVLSINLGQDPFPVAVGEMGIATEVHDRAAARAAIRNLLVDRQTISAAARRQEQYFERNPHLRARPAAVGIARRIESLAAGNAPVND